ncbi:MAG: 2-hydroxyacid dehydrogenase [Candidatus Sulfobium sp.]|jgi:phosphoglycerate dehydrogenase-like enzyme
MKDRGHNIVVTFRPPEGAHSLFREVLGQGAAITFLKDASAKNREKALTSAGVMLTWDPARELKPEEFGKIDRLRLLQLLSAGADHLPFDKLPRDLIIASNTGAYAEPMAEHVLALTLALAKNLVSKHRKLLEGEFDQLSPNRMLRGSICGIIGFGGVGRATGRLMRAMGVAIQAINTSGATADPVRFVGTIRDLDRVLSTSDVIVVSLPLKKQMRGIIGRRELSLMKPDAILINVARGDIIDEKALYEHVRDNTDFKVGIDAWWFEPFKTGEFCLNYPLLELPNALGSPHNSAIVEGAMLKGARRAAENVRSYLDGGPLKGLVKREEYE